MFCKTYAFVTQYGVEWIIDDASNAHAPGFIPDRFAQHGSSPVDPSLPDLSEIVTAATQTAALASYGLIPMPSMATGWNGALGMCSSIIVIWAFGLYPDSSLCTVFPPRWTRREKQFQAHRDSGLPRLFESLTQAFS